MGWCCLGMHTSHFFVQATEAAEIIGISTLKWAKTQFFSWLFEEVRVAVFLEQPLLLPALISASRYNSSYCPGSVPVPDQRYILHALPVRGKWSMVGVLTYGQSLEWMYPLPVAFLFLRVHLW